MTLGGGVGRVRRKVAAMQNSHVSSKDAVLLDSLKALMMELNTTDTMVQQLVDALRTVIAQGRTDSRSSSYAKVLQHEIDLSLGDSGTRSSVSLKSPPKTDMRGEEYRADVARSDLQLQEMKFKLAQRRLSNLPPKTPVKPPALGSSSVSTPVGGGSKTLQALRERLTPLRQQALSSQLPPSPHQRLPTSAAFEGGGGRKGEVAERMAKLRAMANVNE